MKTNINDLL